MLLALLKDGEGLMEHQARYLDLRRSLASLKWSIWYYLGKQIVFLPGEYCSFKRGVFKGLLSRVQWHYGRWFQSSGFVWHRPGSSNSESWGSRRGQCGLMRLENKGGHSRTVAMHSLLLPSSWQFWGWQPRHTHSLTGVTQCHSVWPFPISPVPWRLSPSWSRDACFSTDECCSRCSFSVRLHWFKNV